ncbi:two pore domain potassium channel family protein [Pseudorhodobacter sp. E13]|uniref:ion channel n=1 Tax=Pseudorhodobacter sp. E13 TaxID=2487931 RepID=UPI000F8E6638|nr:ion channel [Pseudorhodobacter sp. E13]RUS58739.1 two pore domain potassium channel family protein [Pseudorhodobacter sp. E13]
MFLQIAIGTGLMLLSIAVGGAGILAMEMGFARSHRWLVREPHRPKLLLVMLGVSFVVLGIITAGVWIWALAFYALGVFITLEASVYFSLVSFTTLGFGDVLLPQEWRLLSGMAAANGLLNFGLLTALLVEALRHVRLGQMNARKGRE